MNQKLTFWEMLKDIASAAEMLLRKVPMMVPRIAMRTGAIPPGIIQDRRKTRATPQADPINELATSPKEEPLGTTIIVTVIAKAAPSETPIIAGDAR
ncbi:hypothetical protein D3C75_1005070 [compost metagenome]